MQKSSATAVEEQSGRPAGTTGTPLSPLHPLLMLLIIGGAFAIYWTSSFILDARGGTMHFGADTLDFAPLAEGQISGRNLRFHMLTIAMSLTWMKLTLPFAAWIELENLHRAMFALIGALGVWAALSAFANFLPRKYVALFGIIYASSLGIWYFASIEESKIISATLTSLYIAVYFRLRSNWTARGAVLLTVVLLAACLNEIVAGFLVVIPAVDVLMRHGLDFRKGRWILLHALTVPAALLFLELLVNGIIAPASENPENASHFSMFFYYLTREYRLAALYIYLINWFFFTLAAPAAEAAYIFDRWPLHPHYFEPALANYFRSPVQVAIAIVFFLILAGALLSLWRRKLASDTLACLSALLAFALLRCFFFYFIHPLEGMLFSNSVILAHLLLLGVPFVASQLPAKRLILVAFAALLFLGNGMFIVGNALR